MKVRSKLIIVIVFVALAPLAVSAWTTIDLHQTAFESEVGESQRVSASYGATLAQAQLEAAQRGLSGIVQGTHWPSLAPAEREGGAWLVFGQLDEIASVMIIDGEGAVLEPTASLPPSVTDPEWAEHPHLGAEGIELIRNALPVDEARRNGQAVGRSVFVDDVAFLPIAFAVEGISTRSTPWVVGVGLSISNICAHIVDNRPPDTRVAVWDESGRLLCGSSEPSRIAYAEIRNRERATFRTSESGDELIAALAETPMGWVVVIEQTAATALAAARQMRMQTFFWIGLGLFAAIVTGTILARGITKPLRALQTGAHRVAGGDYETAIGIDSKDELGEVAEAFNAMSKEIQTWNTELTSRVEQRTRELETAQDQLLAVRKQAAVAALSAGVAHELNNPLASIVAFTQILASKARKSGDTKKLSVLESMEREALRMRDVVSRMQRLAEERAGEHEIVRIDTVFDTVLEHLEHRIDEHSVEVTREIEPDMSVHGAPEDLAKAIEQICDNAIKAMQGEQRQLRLRARDINGEVVLIEVQDTGSGMDPEHVERAFEPFYTTKDADWRGVGLGLSLVHRIVEDHGGTISIDSVVDRGTTVSISIPAARERTAHLV